MSRSETYEKVGEDQLRITANEISQETIPAKSIKEELARRTSQLANLESYYAENKKFLEDQIQLLNDRISGAIVLGITDAFIDEIKGVTP